MQPLKIYINTLPITYKSGGIKTFLLKLLDSFAAQENKNFEYHLICSLHNKPIFLHYSKHCNFKLIVYDIKNAVAFKRIFFEQFRLNRFLKNQKNSILLNICNVAVIKCSIPQITIIQAPLSIHALRKTLPGKYLSLSLMHRIYYDLLVMRSIDISAKTVAVSNYMKSFLSRKQDKIEVIYEGVDTEQFQEKANNKSLFEKPYILAVNTLFPYKNTDKIIKAYSIFKKKGFNHKLVIAGRDPDGKQISFLKKIARKHNVSEFVEFVGMVPHDEIPKLYQNAILFIFLSSVETFGLPILEAMSSGIPVIASNKMSIPEVVGNAGILVNPDDINDIATRIEDVATCTGLRKKMIADGNENIKLFDWNATAQKFVTLFVEVAKNKSAIYE